MNQGLPYTAEQLLAEFPPIEEAPRARSGKASSDSPFAQINAAAFADLNKWVPDLFPTAWRRSGGKGWRVNSEDLGRGYQEDLSVTPQGAKYFGVHDQGDARQGRRTPIDLVIEFGNAANSSAAARWLADKLGIEFGAAASASVVTNRDRGKTRRRQSKAAASEGDTAAAANGAQNGTGTASLIIPPPESAQPRNHPPDLASNLRILAEFSRCVRLRGLVGENATAQLLYLAITSRLLDKPVSAGVKGHSSSGKSHTVDRVLEFFPGEAVLKFTGMSERALVYRDADYKHRTLVIYEVAGLRENKEDDLTAYFMRSLLSEGRIEYEVTVRGEGGRYTTQHIVKEGPTNLIFTTTQTKVHAENETRVLSLNTDDGTEQTRAVLAALASETEHRVDLSQWRALQAWLQTAEHRVTIPYARSLAELVPPVAVRLRRDFGAVLSLIRAHAILHQQTRDRDEAGRIVATIAGDYAGVRALVADVISEGIGAAVSETVRETVAAVDTLVKIHTAGVLASDIAKHLEIDKSNATRRVRRAAEGGFIRNHEEKRGRPGRWVIGDPLLEEIVVLPEADALRTQPATARNPESHGMPSGCAVARVSEGVHRPAANGEAPPDTEAAPWRADPAESCNWANLEDDE